MSNTINTITNKFTWHDFSKRVGNYTEYLTNLGITDKSRVLLSSENSYEFIVVFFALVQKGCSIVLVDCLVEEKELKLIAKQAKCDFCLCDRKYSSNPEISFIHLPLNKLTESSKYKELSIEDWQKRKDALIFYTSGSTGQPKGIVKSGESFITNIMTTIERMEYTDKDVLLPLIPFTHFYGLSIVFIWWFMKCEIVLCHYKKIRSILKAISEHDVTVVDAVPSTFYIFNQLLIKKVDLQSEMKNSNVRMWCVGGAPLPQKLSETFSELIGKPLLDGYGLSEIGNVALNTKSSQFGCGKLLESVQIRIINEEGIDLPRGETGEVLIKSPGIMENYLDLPIKTKEAFHEEWFKTNDLGFQDHDGHLFIIGRKGKAILRKGYIIYPASIEKTLSDGLGINTVALSFKDEKRGSKIILVVEDSKKQRKELKKEINQYLNDILRPDKIIILEEFPHLPNGKINQLAIYQLAEDANKKRKEV